MLLDSTSSLMRTASSTFQCLIGSARRASYCGQPDPSVQLAPNATSGSLYLRSANANSTESSLSNVSYDEQRRRVTIYDGRIPSAPVPLAIPFELMTPIEAITHAVADPVESFVQIVLETPEERPLIIPPLPPSPTPSMSSSTHNAFLMKTRTDSPKPSRFHRHLASRNTPARPEASQTEEFPAQTNDVFEPMDFSFLDPVLEGESAPPPLAPRNHTLASCSEKLHFPRHTSNNDDSAIEIRTPSRSSCSSNRIRTIDDDLTSPDSLSGEYQHYDVPSPSRTDVPASIR